MRQKVPRKEPWIGRFMYLLIIHRISLPCRIRRKLVSIVTAAAAAVVFVMLAARDDDGDSGASVWVGISECICKLLL